LRPIAPPWSHDAALARVLPLQRYLEDGSCVTRRSASLMCTFGRRAMFFDQPASGNASAIPVSG